MNWYETPEFKAELQRCREMLTAALGRLTISPRCRLDVRPRRADEYRWSLQGGGCEVAWDEEPSQADIDRSERLLTIGDVSYFAERG